MSERELARYDYRFWRWAEAITLTQGQGGATHSITHALRETPVTRDEKMPMGARYLDARTTWRVPEVLLPEGTELLPGDTITADAFFNQSGTAQSVWTVQSGVQHNPFDGVWVLPALRLFLHPRLTTTVDIQRPVLDSDSRLPIDDTGAEYYSYQTVYLDEPAAVIFQGRDEEKVDGVEGGTERWLVVVSRELTITNLDRVLVGHTGTGTIPSPTAMILDVMDYQDSDNFIDELPRLVCVRRPT